MDNFVEDEDDKQDNDSGIQNDDKDEFEEKIIKKKNKPSFKIKSPKKSSSRSKSPVKNLPSPEKSPKKRKKKLSMKIEKKEHDGTIVPNPQFDAERTSQRYISRYYEMQINSFIEINIMKVVSSTSRNINRLQTVDRDFCFPQSQTENQDQDSLRSSIQEGFAE